MGSTPEGGGAAMGPDARALRLLRALVTVLTAVMIAGIVSVVALLVIRMPDGRALAAAPVPDAIRLPRGVEATAFTRGPNWFAVVTGDDRILIYGADGTLRQEVRIEVAGGG